MTVWRFAHDYQSWSDAERLFITRVGLDGKKLIVKPFVFEEIERGVSHDVASLETTRIELEDGLGSVTEFLQAAMDCAYARGLRPTGAPLDSSAELSAVRYHLEDMRKLAKVK